MTPQEIDRLARKWQDGTISDEERVRFERWYRSFDDTVLEIDGNEGEAAMKSRLYRRIVDAGAIIDVRPTRDRLKWMRYTAVAALLLVAFLFYWNRQNAFIDQPWIAHVNVHAGNTIRQEILPDGTIIWLKPGATLHYLKAFKSRDVQLTGEALFEVSKMHGRPFRVRVGDYVATVLGTSFNIRQSENNKDMEVVVLTGKVAVSRQHTMPENQLNAAASKPEIVLMPNQQLKTGERLQPEASAVKTIDLKYDNEYTQGTAYNMWFDDTPFEEVARRISTKFGVTVEASGGQYRTCRISANLIDQSLEYTAELVAAALGAEYTIEKDKIKLKGGGCL